MLHSQLTKSGLRFLPCSTFDMTSAERSSESYPDRVENLKARLAGVASRLNAAGGCHLQLHQQIVTRKHLSLTGGNGRMYVVPTADAFDIVLSGISLTQQLTPVMTRICNQPCAGYKQRNAKKQQVREPFWRVEDFAIVEEAITAYSMSQPSTRRTAK